MKNKLAILRGEPVRKKKFEYVSPIGKEEKEAVIKVLDKGLLSGFFMDFEGGEKVKEFEKAWAKYFGSKHAVAVNSGTTALHVALGAAGIGPGDEVIVSSYSFTATASAIVMNNAVPIFCDINSKTYNIDGRKIEELITDKTKAIVPVHLFGQPADMDRIMEIAKKHKLIVVEDACQAPGSKYKGKYVGTIGHLGVFSTVETKNIVTGEGGVITTDDDELAHRCKLIRNHGEAWMAGKPRPYLSNMLGYNFRFTEIQAAIGIEQLKKLKKINEKRNELAHYLLKNLKGLKGISLPEEIPNINMVYHILCLQYDEKATGLPKKIYMEALQKEGINVTIGYPHPMYMNPLFTNKIAFGNKGCPFTCPFYGKEVSYGKGLSPVAEDVCAKSIFVPDIRPPNTFTDMKDIVEAFKKVNDNFNELKNAKKSES